MEADQPIRSPARRARRCVLGLYGCLVVMVGGYTVLRADQPPVEKKALIVAADRGSTAVSARPSAN